MNQHGHTIDDCQTLQIGQKIVIPWCNLPAHRPQGGASFGNGLMFFIAEPTDAGPELRRVEKVEAVAYFRS